MNTSTPRPGVFRRLGNAVLRHRYGLLALVDALIWAVALPAAAFARTEFVWSRIDKGDLVIAVLVVVVVQFVAGVATGIYLGRRKMASFEEVGWVAATAAIGVGALLLIVWFSDGPHLVPRSAILAAGAYEIVGALAFRFIIRLLAEGRNRNWRDRNERVLVYGAGTAGEQVVRALRDDQTSDLLPVAFLDDDPVKARLRLLGLPIEGGRDRIEPAARKHDAAALIIAMPSTDQSTVLDVADRAQKAGLAVRVVPRLDRFLTEPVAVMDIRDITLADFLSRDEVALDLDEIARYVEGKVVLVTGAGGSIGSELTDRVRRFSPRRLLMIDNSENNLHSLQLRLEGRALLTSPDLILADIRDRDGMRDLFDLHRPDVVFHTAAHKHVTFLERYPAEAVRTNVFGTENVLRAAVAAGVERFVNISTDKAADPVSVLGLTKRIGERLTSFHAVAADGVFMSVRFGNVLGSSGSVIPTFREQLALGETITVTDPEVTRYFMTIPEAVQLVLQAGALGRAGEVLVLDMGDPVKIVDLVHRLAAEVRPGIPPTIEYTGLRDGEKLHEVLVSEHDELLDQPHPLLLRYKAPPLAAEEIAGLVTIGDPAALRVALGRVAAAADVGAAGRRG